MGAGFTNNAGDDDVDDEADNYKNAKSKTKHIKVKINRMKIKLMLVCLRFASGKEEREGEEN